MANASVGGLYVTVSLDTKRATAQLAAMGVQFNRALGSSSAGARGANKVTKSLNSVTKAAKGSTTEVKGLRGALSKLGNTFNVFGRQLGSGGQRALGSMTTAAGGLSKSLGGLTVGAAASGAALAAVAVVAIATAAAIGTVAVATYKLGKAGFEVAKELELLEVSLIQILGSAEAAQAEMSKLIEIAAESPFLTPAVIEMDKFLLSQGLVSAEIRGNLIPAILDMAAAYGLGTEQLRSISYAMAQVQSRGYLSGDELRQLANQFVPVWDILREIPVLAERSQSEIRKMSEQGQISAEAFQLALTSYAQRFGDAAQQAAETVRGLGENIKDITTIRIGKAFLDLRDVEGAVSPLEAVREVLLSIKGLVQEVDFRPLAASMGLFVEAFTGEASRFLNNNTQGIIDFLQVSLPNAIRFSASVMNVLVQSFKVGIQFVSAIVGAITSAFGTLQGAAGGAVGGWANTWKALAAVSAIVGGAIITIIQAVAAAFSSLINFITGNFGALDNDFNNFVGSFSRGLDFVESAYRGMATAIDAAAAIKLPNLGDTLGGPIGEFQEGMGERAAAVDAGNGAGGATKKVTDDIAKAMDLLWDLTRRWQGFRSELEKGLLGKEGFEATLDQIIAMGKKVHEALLVIGDTSAADAVAAATLELYALAGERLKVVDALKEAESELKNIISARERFASDLRRSAIAFAAALDLETETTKRWELQSDRGFFIESEETKVKSFTDTLRERGKALKEFFANIKALQEQGLDEDFIKSLLIAGPEASGEVAAALAAGGQEMVDEVNVLYDDIAKTAELLGEYGAEKFYDAGVEQAQSLVDGLNEELDSITVAAEHLTDIIFQEAEKWAQKMTDAGKAAGGGAASGLKLSSAAISASAAGLALDITDQFGEVPDIMEGLGGDAGSSFADALGDSLDFDDTFTTALEDIRAFVVSVEKTINDIDTAITFWKWDWAEIWRSFRDGMLGFLGKIPGVLLNFLGLGNAANALRGSSYYSYGSSSSGGGGGGGAGRAIGSGFSVTMLDTHVTGVGDAVTSAQGFGVVSEQQYEPIVKVYIGDEELRGIVRTEVTYNDRGEASRVLTGRRV